VTLEPCSHHGQRPPCTEAIIAAGIERVVFAAVDPNPEAEGGAARLRAAGIEVVGEVEAGAAQKQNALFFHTLKESKPFIALKYALTLDARLAETPDRPSVVTGPLAREETHWLRAGFDAIMVGSGTALADDPLLTVRGEVVPRVPPARVIVDTEARLPTTARLLRSPAEGRVFVVCAEDAPAERRVALEGAGAEIIAVPRGGAGVEIDQALDRLSAEGIRSVFCEGGGRLGATLLSQDLVSRLYLFYAPLIFGDMAVPAFPGGFGGAAATWRQRRLQSFGDDLLVVLDREL
jgi:diaminohydroxyphosphoribosylaminopyrimidine deaminase/5-amino-6-(5-phosphoribosylamino)uracil reductase